MTHRLFTGLATVVVALVTITGAIEAKRIAPSYSIVDLGTLGGSESFAYALNDLGEIVGLSRTRRDAATHAFLYHHAGAMRDLEPLDSGSIQTGWVKAINERSEIASGVVHRGVYLPAVYSSSTRAISVLGALSESAFFGVSGVATGLNGLGHAVGYSYIDNVSRHAFVARDGVMTDIGSLGGDSVAYAINDDGVIVGVSSDIPFGLGHAFIYDGVTMRELDPFGGPNNESYAYGINRHGHVVGEALAIDGGFRGFVYANAGITDIGTLPGALTSAAYSINDRGDVVGVADSPYDTVCPGDVPHPCTQYEQFAVLYKEGQLHNMNSLIPSRSGWSLAAAFDINASGQIVGYGIRKGRARAFLMTPNQQGR